jgi:hypothetical protein
MTDGRHPGSVMARLERPRADRSTRLAVVADPHVATRAEGTSKLFEHSLEHFECAIADADARDVDAVLSPGDLTKDGEPWNYDAVDDVLDGLEAPFYAVPGNHDVPKEGDDHETMPVSAFAERYAAGGLPFRERVGGVDVLGLNSAGSRDRLYDTHEGAVDPAQLEWLEAELADAETPLVLTHFNLPAVSDQIPHHRDTVEPEMAIPPASRETDALLEALSAGTEPLVLTGHLHLPATGVSEGVRELMTPTTCSFPQSYLLVEVGPEGTTVRLVPVADSDGMAYGHRARSGDSVTARGLTAIAAARLATFPLVDESGDR